MSFSMGLVTRQSGPDLSTVFGSASITRSAPRPSSYGVFGVIKLNITLATGGSLGPRFRTGTLLATQTISHVPFSSWE